MSPKTRKSARRSPATPRSTATRSKVAVPPKEAASVTATPSLRAFQRPQLPAPPRNVPPAVDALDRMKPAPPARTAARAPAPTPGPMAAPGPAVPASSSPRGIPNPTAQIITTASAPVLAADMPSGPLQVMTWSCESLGDADPQGLGLTYWFDAAPDGAPYPVSIRLSGRRTSGPGFPGARDTFQTVRTLDRVLPGSGRIALTERIGGIPAGTWEITATPVIPSAADGSPARTVRPALPPPSGAATGTTTYFPVARVRAPGVRLGAWPALVGTGAAAALLVQGILGAQRQLPVGRLFLISVLACLIGLAGAKTYYLLTHREEKPNPLTAGMSIQGFVIAAVASVVLGSWWAGVPIGPMLDVTAPGLLLGLTIGRLGCFFGGCCAGRPTASRWGIWSSDRRVGVRRIPVQLLESSLAGILALSTTVAVATMDPPVDGLHFVAGFGAYTLGRQLLFPLRGIPRKTAYGRVVTLAVSTFLVAGAIAAQFLF